jgi:adenylate cyclase
MAYEGLGRAGDAQDACRRAFRAAEQHLELNPNDARALYMGAVDLIAQGDPERAIAWAERALAVDPGDAGVLYNVGCAFARLGRRDRAMDCLVRAMEAGFGNREWIENDPDLAPLRSDPRLKALLDRI